MTECDHEHCQMEALHDVEVCQGVMAKDLGLCDHNLLVMVSEPDAEVRRLA